MQAYSLYLRRKGRVTGIFSGFQWETERDICGARERVTKVD